MNGHQPKPQVKLTASDGEEAAIQACYLLLGGHMDAARVCALRAIYLATVRGAPEASEDRPEAP